jgi:hypothetical protein
LGVDERIVEGRLEGLEQCLKHEHMN